MTIIDSHSFEFISRSTEQTRRVGMRIGSQLKNGDVLYLVGDLGSGKTTFVQGLAKGWGSLDQVSSPTFVLINLYRRPDGNRLYHLDAYRLNSVEEAVDLDIEVLTSGGPLVVEWADRILPALPKESLQVTFKNVDENQRDLLFTAYGRRYEYLLQNLRKLFYGVR